MPEIPTIVIKAFNISKDLCNKYMGADLEDRLAFQLAIMVGVKEIINERLLNKDILDMAKKSLSKKDFEKEKNAATNIVDALDKLIDSFIEASHYLDAKHNGELH